MKLPFLLIVPALTLSFLFARCDFLTGDDELEPEDLGSGTPLITSNLNWNVTEDGSVEITVAVENPSGEPLTPAILVDPKFGTAEILSTAPPVARQTPEPADGVLAEALRDDELLPRNAPPDELAEDERRRTPQTSPPGPVKPQPAVTADPEAKPAAPSAGKLGGTQVQIHVRGPSGLLPPSIQGNTVFFQIRYTPNDDFTGEDCFTFGVSNPSGSSSEAEICVTVDPGQDPPTLDNEIPNLTLEPGQTYQANLDTVFSDPDGEALSFSAQSNRPEIATAEAVGGGSTLRVIARTSGTTTILVTATDPGGLFVSDRFDVAVAVPGQPFVENSIPDTTLVLGVPFEVRLGVVFTDPDPENTDPMLLVYTAQSSNPGAVRAEIDKNEIDLLRVTAQATGVAIVTATITDLQNNTASASFQVSTSVVNAVDDQAQTEADTSVLIPVLDNDRTNSPPLTVDLEGVALPENGQVERVPPNAVRYTPEAGFEGTDHFEYLARNALGVTDRATVEVAVSEGNGPPFVVNPIVEQTLQVQTSRNLALGNVFDDPNGDALSFSAASQDTTIATATTNGPTLTLTGVREGTTSVTVTATDPGGLSASTSFGATVTTTATPNMRPVAVDDRAVTNKNESEVIRVLDNDADTDGTPDPTTVRVVSNPANGTSIPNTTGAITYTPSDDFIGEDEFTYTFADDQGTVSDTATVTVTVNDPPVAVADSYPVTQGGMLEINADAGVLANDLDTEEDNLMARLVSDVKNGDLRLDDDGSFTYEHNGSPTPSDSFTYRAFDGVGISNVATATITIELLNTLPVVEDLANQTNLEGDAPTAQIVATDADNDPLTYTASGLPDSLDIDPDTGTIAGTIVNNAAGPDGTMTYEVVVEVSDGKGDPVSTSFDWTVTNPLPEVICPSDPSSMEGDTPTVQVQANDDDVLTYAAENLPDSLDIDPDTGTIAGTIANDAAGDEGEQTVAVDVTVTDAQGGMGSATCDWTITNPTPMVTSPGDKTNEAGETITPLQIQATDDDAALNYDDQETLPPGLSINDSTGVISGTIEPDAAAQTYSVDVTVTDAQGGSGSTSFDWTVEQAIPAPTLTTVEPDTGLRDEVLDVTLTGSGFVEDVTSVSFSGSGIEVDAITVDAPNQITATIIINDDAPFGNYTVTVTNEGQSGSLPNAFTVIRPAPELTSIDPTEGVRLETLDVILTGTQFSAEASSADFGPDITVDAITVDAPEQITATITIGTEAELGARDVSVTNAAPGGGTSTLDDAFTVVVGPILVNTTADNTPGDGLCTLREAIANANNDNDTSQGDCPSGTNVVPDSIVFNIDAGVDPGCTGGVCTIQPSAANGPLPDITNALIIDGSMQPGADCGADIPGRTLTVALDGSLAGSGDGLRLASGSDGSTIRGLIIHNWADDGIEIDGSNNNTVECNFIGTDAAGTDALSNNRGISVQALSDGNVIGGTAAAAGNLISGNTLQGVLINGVSARNNRIEGNFIGTDATGTDALGNAIDGVYFSTQTNNNTVGGTAAGARNIISGNSNGIRMDALSSDNVVEGNYIGTDVHGTAAVGNTNDGVLINNGASNNTIGGTATGAGNVISRNDGDGVEITDSGTTGNLVQGNLIGTDANGTASLGNAQQGVRIDNAASTNTIGGTVAGARNLISGNTNNGVRITGSGTTGNLVQGNFIGTDVDGDDALGNGLRGVRIDNAASNNTIGGTSAGAGNLISGNDQDGVLFFNSGTTGNRVQGNLVGTDASGATGLGNGFDGVNIVNGPSNNTVGGANPGEGNTIAFNDVNGVVLAADAGTGNAIRGNSIFQNIFLGIDLGDDGVTPNDPGDPDSSPNNLQNFPKLSAIIDAGDLIVTYRVDSDPTNATYPLTVEFFEADTDQEEGQTLVATDSYTTGDHNGCGSAPCFKTANLGDAASLGISIGEFIVATATDDDGNTSEFSAAIDVQAAGNIVVNTTADNTTAGDGLCTLREAITNANQDGDTTDWDCAAGSAAVLDTIEFNISGGGVQTIQPTSALPVITEGVLIDGYTQPGSSANTLSVGSDAVLLIELDGTSAGASVDGLEIAGSGSTIRGLVINRFSLSGIVLTGAGATGNTVEGNFIGTDVNGTADLGNSTDGVVIKDGASTNTIGGTTAAARNVISGNNSYGVRIQGSGTTGNVVRGNFIGTDAGGTADLGNAQGGVFIQIDASTNTVGGTTAGAGNIISGNDGDGVVIGNGSSGNMVQGNFIGTDVNGTADLGNTRSGINLFDGASSNTIGGTTASARNVISGNNQRGVLIGNSSTTGNFVQGNFIGTDATGTADLGNTFEGVIIVLGASNNTIGGTVAGAGNIISDNSVGVLIQDSGTTGNVVRGNLIGTDVNGTADLGNSNDGVQILGGAATNTIGGTAAGAGNVISGNNDDGVHIRDSGTDSNIVQGNLIGTDAAGTDALGNGFNGVRINFSAANTTVGGSAQGALNVISGNGSGGVRIVGSNDNTVAGNLIGTDVNGTANLGNTNNGVGIEGDATGNTIGGTALIASNTIAFNGGDGVMLNGSGTTGNAIRGNSIFENTQLGIDLGNDGMTPNDPGDPDSSPNNLQNFPKLSATIDAGDLIVTYRVDSDPANATYPLTVEFFEADTDQEEGQALVATDSYTTGDHNGCGSAPCFKTANLGDAASLGISIGEFIVATATDDAGNTSEFSGAIDVQALSNIVVNTTADNTTAGDGLCTLREAITNANQNGDTTNWDCAAGSGASTDVIEFNIAGGGVQTIQPTSALPVITEGVLIDGYTQPGSSANTLSVGSDAVLLIELDGTSAGASVDGLEIAGSGSTIRGLVINRFSLSGIVLTGAGATGNTVEGNFIGTDVNGTADLGNSTDGVVIKDGASTNTIGGTTAAARNVISGNNDDGVHIRDSGTDSNIVQGNLIGTDAAGTDALGNGFNGVRINFSAANTTVGGSAQGALNVISGNGSGGVRIVGSNDNTVAGNLIGTDVNGTANLGNTNNGVGIEGDATGNTIGGTALIASNTIAFNGGDGVMLNGSGTTGNAIRGNSIFENTQLGIDLGNDGATSNDANDPDTGPNLLQNFPTITAAVISGGNLLVTYSVDSAPFSVLYPITVEIFEADTDQQEGQTFLGSDTYTTGDHPGTVQVNLGNAASLGVSLGDRLVATATDANDNTSEFSASVTVN